MNGNMYIYKIYSITQLSIKDTNEPKHVAVKYEVKYLVIIIVL